MNQQRFAAMSALGGTLFLIGSVAVMAGFGGARDDGAPIAAVTPQASAKADRQRAAFSDRFSNWASVAGALAAPQVAPPVAVAPRAPDPVREVIEAAAPPVDLPKMASADARLSELLPPATIASASKPDPAQDVVETAAPLVDTAVTAAIPEPQPPAAFALAGTSDPVLDVVETPAAPLETAVIVAAAAPEPQMLPDATPPAAIASASTSDLKDDVEAAASPLETAAIANIDAVVSAPRPPVRLVSLFRPAAPIEDLKPVVRLVETPNECLVAEICIDDYLWALYERTPKVDTNKVTHRIKTTIRKKGKTRTVSRTVVKYVLGDFTWKDPIAAQKFGMSLKDYVIGGMDRRFKQKLYHALRQMDAAGHMPGITSAFRDDYRQAIATGNKAASDSSYHGGSRRGGYGHGLAIDLVSVKGETRMERWASTVELWKWIDAREQELGVGRPYLHRDPPHVVPIDGKEFADKRGGVRAKRAGSAAKKVRPVAVGRDPAPKPAETKPAPVRVGSIQPASS